MKRLLEFIKKLLGISKKTSEKCCGRKNPCCKQKETCAAQITGVVYQATTNGEASISVSIDYGRGFYYSSPTHTAGEAIAVYGSNVYVRFLNKGSNIFYFWAICENGVGNEEAKAVRDIVI
jgi:urate oxidase